MRSRPSIVASLLLLGASCASPAPSEVLEQRVRYTETAALPDADRSGGMPLERTLSERRSVRSFTAEDLTLGELGQLFWAGQGTTDDTGHRTAPSAGALYPIELYAITATELIHYVPDGHQIEQRPDSRTLPLLADAAFQQNFISEASAVLIITGVNARTEEKYGPAADHYVNREAGHVAQNLLLQATSLGLAAVPVGGFDADQLARMLALPSGEDVLYLVPVGHAR